MMFRPGFEPGSPGWKATILTTRPRRLQEVAWFFLPSTLMGRFLETNLQYIAFIRAQLYSLTFLVLCTLEQIWSTSNAYLHKYKTAINEMADNILAIFSLLQYWFRWMVLSKWRENLVKMSWESQRIKISIDSSDLPQGKESVSFSVLMLVALKSGFSTSSQCYTQYCFIWNMWNGW